MKRIAVLLFASAAAVCARAENITVDSLVATVNGEPVRRSEVQSAMRSFLEAAARDPALRGRSARDIARAAFTNALADAENRRLIVQKYRAGDLRMPDYAVDRTVVDRIERQYGGDVHALQLELARDGLTYSEWKDMVEEQLIVTTMRQTFVNANVHVSPGEVVREWEENREAWVPAPRVRAAIAVFPLAATNELAAFRSRLAAGERFEALVADPTDEERMLGAGDYGWIDPSAKLAPEFANVLLSIPDGASSPLVLGDWTYLVCRVESETVPETTLESAWEKIEEELWSRQAARIYEAWVAHLREGAAIREFLPEDLF